MKKLFITIIATLMPMLASAEIVKYGSLWYNMHHLPSYDYDAELIASQSEPYSGDIIIPRYIFYDGVECPVTAIGNSAFEGCTGLSSVEIPNTVRTIGDAAFWQCTSLKLINIPDGVATIGDGAFMNCYNLVSVVLPSTVTSIGSSAFGNCTNLTQVISRIQNPFDINQNVFITYSTTSLVIPKGTKAAYQARSGWKMFTNINDDSTKRTIHVATAGTLPYFIPDDEKYQIEELTLSGELNGTDFRLIRDMAGVSFKFRNYQGAYYPETNGILNSLDISNIYIVEGGNGYTIVDEGYGSVGTVCPEMYYDLNTKNNCISTLLFYKTKLKSIILPNSVTIIEDETFKDCSALTSITIPQRVISIGNYAFSGCSSLNSIMVESGNSIYDSRNDCNAIIEKSSNILLVGCNNTIIPNSVTSIGQYAFSGRAGLTSITIPNSVTSIGNSAFGGCTGLTSVTIGNSVTSIGGSAFSGCRGLTSITIPNSVTSIDGGAFYGCSGLTSITIPNSVTHIGGGAFSGCNGLKIIFSKIEWPFKIDSGVFSEETYTNAQLIVPKDKKWFYLQTEGWNMFKNIVEEELVVKEFEANGVRYLLGESNTVSVTSKPEKYTGAVSIPSQVYYDGIKYSVTSIGQSAFEGCIDMTSVTIPSSVTTIGDAAFYYCTGLTTIDIPNGVTTIGEGAFSKCGGLASLSIPGSVTSIGKNTFFQCYALTQITSGIEKPFTIDDGVFPTSVYNNASLFVTSGKKSAYQNTAGWKRFANIVEMEKKRTIHVETAGTLGNLISEHEMYYIEELTLSGELNGTDIRFIRDLSGINFGYEPNCLTFCKLNDIFTSGKLKVLDISNANIVSGGDCYYGWTLDKNNEFEELKQTKTNTISDYMFYGCHLEKVKLPKSITSIEVGAFRGCSSLTSITIPNSVTSIGQSAFQNCSGLTTIVSEIENPFTIGDDVFNCSDKDIYATATLIVPIGKKSAYQSTAGWNKFQNIVEAGGGDKVFEADGVRYSIGENNTVSVTSKPEKYTGAISILSLVYYDGINYTVTSIGQSAFEGCVDMTSVSIPSSVTTIGGAAFYYCTGLMTVDIPDGVTIIGEGAFSKCEGLTSVTIPGSVTSIGKNAFFQCYGLTQITSGIESPFAIDDGVFPTSVYNNASLIVPYGTKSAYQNTAGWKRFQNIVSVGGVYKLTYYVDGEEYKSVNYDYGAEITPEPAPSKEGYTFSGWSYIPSTMPAEEVNVFGSFTVNQYTITYIIDGEQYASEMVDFNSKIVPPTPPSKDGFDFAWEEYPETMPAHDITINGAYTTTGILSIAIESGKAKIFTLDGRQVDTPQKGINIIRMDDGTIKKVVLSK